MAGKIILFLTTYNTKQRHSIKKFHHFQFFFRIRLNPTAELSYYTPEKVAIATVRGILKNKQYVSMPWFMKFLLTWVQ